MAEITFIGAAAINARSREAMRAAIEQSAEHLAAEQMAAETAVETGTLRASIHVDEITETGDTVTAINATGGESSAYAAYIHEGHRADGTHVIHAYPGGLKYMEGPLLANLPFYQEALARAAAGAF